METACFNTYKTLLACKLGNLAESYTNKLIVGDSCASKVRCDLVLASYLLELLCRTPEVCWNENEKCLIIEELENIYNKWNLG